MNDNIHQFFKFLLSEISYKYDVTYFHKPNFKKLVIFDGKSYVSFIVDLNGIVIYYNERLFHVNFAGMEFNYIDNQLECLFIDKVTYKTIPFEFKLKEHPI